MAIPFFITVAGLLMGSFASVLIHRLHTGEGGIVAGRSHCRSCNTTLGARDLVPVFSFLWNHGKCSHCGAPIPAVYPLLECSMAGLFLATALLTGSDSWPRLTLHLFAAFVLVTLTFYDILFQEVPDELVLPAIALSAATSFLLREFPARDLLLGMAVPTLFFGGLFALSHGRWLGGGDVRIGALMGALLGWPRVVPALFLAYLIGSVFSAGGMILKKLNRKSQIPFVPFLFLGTFIALYWGKALIAWYFGMLR